MDVLVFVVNVGKKIPKEGSLWCIELQ